METYPAPAEYGSTRTYGGDSAATGVYDTTAYGVGQHPQFETGTWFYTDQPAPQSAAPAPAWTDGGTGTQTQVGTGGYPTTGPAPYDTGTYTAYQTGSYQTGSYATGTHAMSYDTGTFQTGAYAPPEAAPQSTGLGDASSWGGTAGQYYAAQAEAQAQASHLPRELFDDAGFEDSLTSEFFARRQDPQHYPQTAHPQTAAYPQPQAPEYHQYQQPQAQAPQYQQPQDYQHPQDYQQSQDYRHSQDYVPSQDYVQPQDHAHPQDHSYPQSAAQPQDSGPTPGYQHAQGYAQPSEYGQPDYGQADYVQTADGTGEWATPLEPADLAHDPLADTGWDTEAVAVAPPADEHGEGTERRKTARKSRLPINNTPVAVMGMAAVAVAAVGGLQYQSHEATTTTTSTGGTTATPLDGDLTALRQSAATTATQVSQDQQRVQVQAQAQAQQAQAQQAAAVARAAALAPKYFLPVGDYILTAGFGEAGDHWANLHTGQDFAVPVGTPVHAVTDGVVISAGWAGAYGYRIVVQHADNTQTWYCHLSGMRILSGPVKSDDVIGYSGDTGNTTGPHLHLEVRIDTTAGEPSGTAIDPMPWLRDRGLNP